VIDIELPKLNNNDESYILLEWLAETGAQVEPEQPVALIETSKAQAEIESSAAGILHAAVSAGTDCRPGEVIGHIFSSAGEHEQYLASGRGRPVPVGNVPAGNVPAAGGLVVTKAARMLADRHGLSDEVLAGLGRTVIREADVEAMLAGRTPAVAERELPRRQQAIGAVVTESMRTIPVAAVYAEVDVEAALALPAQCEGPADGFLGLPELLIQAVARQHEHHPLFFATLLADGRVRLAAGPDIGVTVDAGRGLYVPVLRNAATLSLGQTADALMDFRVKALRGTFQSHELAGANIMVALHNSDAITLATPIVFPGQVCAVSLGGTHERLALDGAGAVTVRRQVQIGVVYDHRVVNGRDAVEFVLGLKRALEAPEGLTRQVAA
jgi:2-oxoglutarate dehydrogenase E2 component (dihydrolipoamide succinyltransferase)